MVQQANALAPKPAGTRSIRKRYRVEAENQLLPAWPPHSLCRCAHMLTHTIINKRQKQFRRRTKNRERKKQDLLTESLSRPGFVSPGLCVTLLTSTDLVLTLIQDSIQTFQCQPRFSLLICSSPLIFPSPCFPGRGVAMGIVSL